MSTINGINRWVGIDPGMLVLAVASIKKENNKYIHNVYLFHPEESYRNMKSFTNKLNTRHARDVNRYLIECRDEVDADSLLTDNTLVNVEAVSGRYKGCVAQSKLSGYIMGVWGSKHEDIAATRAAVWQRAYGIRTSRFGKKYYVPAVIEVMKQMNVHIHDKEGGKRIHDMADAWLMAVYIAGGPLLQTVKRRLEGKF